MLVILPLLAGAALLHVLVRLGWGVEGSAHGFIAALHYLAIAVFTLVCHG